MNTRLTACSQLTLLCTFLTGCGSASTMETVKYTTEVEIAPDTWLPIQSGDTVNAADLRPNRKNPHELSPFDALKQILGSGSSRGGGAGAERSSLSFEWNGKQVTWRGKEIPITLREHDGALYMIGFNREKPGKHRFLYFRLNDKQTGFRKIKPRDFPKQIATQNMWLGAAWRFVTVGNHRVDRWKELRELDAESLYFDHSFTAYLWYQLCNDVERHRMPHNIPREFLREYMTKYKPIALPTLVKEKTPDVAPPEPNDTGGENDGNAADSPAPRPATPQTGKP